MSATAGIIKAIAPGQILAQPELFNPNDPDVLEWIQDDISPDEDTITLTNGIGTMDCWIHNPNNDQRLLMNAVAFFVGLSRVGYEAPLVPGTTQYPLIRWLPVFHPRFNYMRCTGVSVKGCLINLTTPSSANFAGQFETTIKLPLPNYQKYRFQLRFEQPMYNVYPDSLSTSEWDRFVDPPATTDETEIITVDGGQYQYNAPSTTSLDSGAVVINGPSIKIYAQRQGLMVRAHNIASDFVMNEYGIMPKFMAAKGRVNSATFLGQPAGTILLAGYKPVLTAQPTATAVLDALLFGIDIDMQFVFTDPPRAEASETRRGWQLVPPPTGGNAAGWYGIYPKGNSSGSLYPVYDFNELLKYWNNGYATP